MIKDINPSGNINDWCPAGTPPKTVTVSVDEPLKIFPDGNQWCVLLGENLQDGYAAFGDTPAQALRAFERAYEVTA